MIENNFEFLQPVTKGHNPHDYFGRKIIGDPLIAADLLRHYSDPVVAEHVDLDHLKAEPTQFFVPTPTITGPKEVRLDVPYITRLRDETGKSEVLLIYEHKSKPNLHVPLQLGVQTMVSLYKRWTDAGRPISRKKFKLPIPLMVMVYCGAEDLDEDLLYFQEMFEDIPEPFKLLVPQFGVVVSNLRRFNNYEHLPGRPETQATVETMNRFFDGTLAEQFPVMLDRFDAVTIDDRIMDIVGDISWFSGCVTDIGPERIAKAITNVIKGKKGIEMAELIQKGIYQQGVEIGETKGKADIVLTLLRNKFNEVPQKIETTIRTMADPTALESLAIHVMHSPSLEEFGKALN